MDAYLQLNREEFEVYYRMIHAVQSPEREAVMQIVNEFQALGEEIGEACGRAGLLVEQITYHLGEPSKDLADRIRQLPAERLRELGMALFNFESVADVDSWFATQG